MREQIILAPGANGKELLQGLARHGMSCMNVRVMGSAELARVALMRSGKTVTEEFVNANEVCALIAQAAAGEAYFGRMTYSDICEIAGAISRIRLLVVDDEEQTVSDTLSKGIFTEKNEALLHVYQKYMQSLKNQNLIDHASLIHRAIEECGPWDADFITLSEYPLKPLEKALLLKVSDSKIQEKTLTDLYQVSSAQVQVSDYRNCYGASNEVEKIIDEIYHGHRLDSCTVAVTDPATYAQLFYDYALLYDLPITFGCGIPIGNSMAARLLMLSDQWITGGFYGAQALLAMLSDSSFDGESLWTMAASEDEHYHRSTLLTELGAIRFTDDAGVNQARLKAYQTALEAEEADLNTTDSRAAVSVAVRKACLPGLSVFAAELALPVEEFISKYARIRKGVDTNASMLVMQVDAAARTAICEQLATIRRSGLVQDTDDIIKNVLGQSVAGSGSVPGKLHVTTIRGALGCVRENLYIAGLSASKYPGSPKENYLLLDADLQLFGNGADSQTSEGRVLQKQETLRSLVQLASGLNAEIHVSYAGMNVSELKRDNASSMIYELFRAQKGVEVTAKELEAAVEQVAYFAPAIGGTREIGKAFVAGKHITGTSVQTTQFTTKGDLEKEYSPSALSTFFNCKRQFLLSNILGIPQPSEEDPFVVLDPLQTGTLAHALMEQLGGSKMTEKEFMTLGGLYFDRFMEEHPPVIPERVTAVKVDFLEMCKTAFEMDPGHDVLLKETELHAVHTTGVKIHGYPDRVEQLPDGKVTIVDYKTGRRISHVQDDPITCLQVLLYAYMMEEQGYPVQGGEYRYIRQGESVTCRYDDEMKNELTKLLEEFKECMERGDFPAATEEAPEERHVEEPCQYCTYAMICHREEGGDRDGN